MKKLITVAAALAFLTGTAMAEDSSQKATTQKTPTQQQMDTQATGGAKIQTQTPAGTTGAGVNVGAQGSSSVPGKATDKAKETPK